MTKSTQARAKLALKVGDKVLRSVIKFCADAGGNPEFSVGYKVSNLLA